MKLTKTFLTSALLGASFYSIHSTAWANTQETQLQQAVAATEKGDFQTALQLLNPLAQQGNAKAQNDLGWTYEQKQDYVEAVAWYRKAA